MRSQLIVLLGLACLALAAPSQFMNDDFLKEGDRLILFTPEIDPVWLSSRLVDQLIRKGIRFMDITEHPEEDKLPTVAHSFAFPTAPTHQTQVNNLKTQVQLSLAQANLATLSSFYTRYYRSTTGVESSVWVYNKALEYAANRSDVTVRQFAHSTYDQQSVIARIQGTDPTLPLVIIGAHQDSINVENPSNGRSPGSDDDGSGTITILEAFRVLVEQGFRPRHSIEFQWYAAEEVGLLGSQDIASSYKRQGIAVYGMFQLDMTGYRTSAQPAVRVITDFVNPELTDFTKALIDTYTTLPRRDHSCGYACSDHASWYRSGYASATTFEAVLNPQIHTATDDLNLIVWDQVQEFIYLAIAYTVELSYGV